MSATARSRRPERRRLRFSAFFNSAAIILAALLFAGPILAQHPEQRWEIFAEGGASIWNNQYMDESILFGSPPAPQTLLITTHVGSSGRLFLGVRFWMNSHEALETSYSYSPTGITVDRHCEHVNCGVVSSSSIARSHFFSVNYVHAFRVHKHVRPFLTAGLGLVYFQAVGVTGPGPITTTVPGGVDLFMNGVFEPDPLTLNVGGGADVQLTK